MGASVTVFATPPCYVGPMDASVGPPRWRALDRSNDAATARPTTTKATTAGATTAGAITAGATTAGAATAGAATAGAATSDLGQLTVMRSP